ncbi:hypothetical protein DQ04_18881000, partial [Trypanosoma grayi]|uniref:hypothetical protein n=1 Tax=Trypanosoma grayi TaxID=71804 RepID=UPI0004F4AF51
QHNNFCCGCRCTLLSVREPLRPAAHKITHAPSSLPCNVCTCVIMRQRCTHATPETHAAIRRKKEEKGGESERHHARENSSTESPFAGAGGRGTPWGPPHPHPKHPLLECHRVAGP